MTEGWERVPKLYVQWMDSRKCSSRHSSFEGRFFSGLVLCGRWCGSEESLQGKFRTARKRCHLSTEALCSCAKKVEVTAAAAPGTSFLSGRMLCGNQQCTRPRELRKAPTTAVCWSALVPMGMSSRDRLTSTASKVLGQSRI